MTIAEFQSQLHTVLDRWYRWVAVVVILIVLLLGWTVFWKDEYRELRDSNIGGYQVTVERLADRNAHLERLRTMEREYSQLEQERLRHIDYVLPNGLDATAVIADLSAFATTAGAHVLNIDVVRSTDTSAVIESDSVVRTAIITLNVQTPDGSYEQLKQLLGALELYTPVLDLETLAYTPGNTSYALQLRTYYREDDTL